MQNFRESFAITATRIATIALLCAIGAGYAQADDARTSVMNKAGTYEQTMAFYLHPAHGFPGVAHNNAEHPAVVAKRHGLDPMVAFEGHIVGHPAIGFSLAHADDGDQPVVVAKRSESKQNLTLQTPSKTSGTQRSDFLASRR